MPGMKSQCEAGQKEIFLLLAVGSVLVHLELGFGDVYPASPHLILPLPQPSSRGTRASPPRGE